MLRSKRLFSNLKPIVNLSRNMSGYNKSHKDHIFKLIESNLVQKSIDMEYKSKILDEIIEFENRKNKSQEENNYLDLLHDLRLESDSAIQDLDEINDELYSILELNEKELKDEKKPKGGYKGFNKSKKKSKKRGKRNKTRKSRK